MAAAWSGTQVTGNGTGTVVVTAPQSVIDFTLADAAGLTFIPTLNFNGDVTLTMLTNDLGHTGITGPSSTRIFRRSAGCRE